MAAPTKLELTQLLAVRNAECEALRVRVAELEGDVAALKAAAEGRARRIDRSVRLERAAYVPSPEQLAFRAAMAAAKELAMRTGRSVRVGQ